VFEIRVLKGIFGLKWVNNNPQGHRLRGRPKNRWWNCVQTYINRCKIENWKERSKNRDDWEKSISEEEEEEGRKTE
jgi:hypothetical protein